VGIFSPGKIPLVYFKVYHAVQLARDGFERDIFGQVGFTYRPFANRPEKSSGWIPGESRRNRKQPVFISR